MVNYEELEAKITDEFWLQKQERAKVEIKSKPGTSDGFICKILHGSVCFLDKNNTVSVVIKVGEDDKDQRLLVAITPMIKREVDFYNLTAPEYSLILEQFESNQSYYCTIPKCYLSNAEYLKEFLILEDMGQKEYTRSTEKLCDYDHAKIVVCTLAKLHGLAYIARKLKTDHYNEWCKKYDTFTYLDASDDYKVDGYKFYVKTMIPVFLKSIKNETLREKLSGLISVDMFSDQVKEAWDHGKYKLLSHCDFWIGNILFKYDENNVPVDGAPIDFQVIRNASVANDILFFFAGSCEPEVRKKYFWDLVDTYHVRLSNILSQVNINLDTFFTLDGLKEEIKGQWFIVIAVGVCYLGPFCLDSLPTAFELHTEQIPPKMLKPSEEYINRVNDLLDDFLHLGIL